MGTRTVVIALLLGVVAEVAAAQEPAKTLAECVAIAVEDHPSLKAADASVAAGKQRVWQATANYLPQVSANYGAQRRQTNSAAFGAKNGRPFRSYFYNTGAS